VGRGRSTSGGLAAGLPTLVVIELRALAIIDCVAGGTRRGPSGVGSRIGNLVDGAGLGNSPGVVGCTGAIRIRTGRGQIRLGVLVCLRRIRGLLGIGPLDDVRPRLSDGLDADTGVVALERGAAGAAFTIAAVRPALLVEAERLADRQALAILALVALCAHAARSAAKVVTALLVRAVGHARGSALAVHAFLPVRAGATRAAA
jgi:hypothetical protein